MPGGGGNTQSPIQAAVRGQAPSPIQAVIRSETPSPFQAAVRSETPSPILSVMGDGVSSSTVNWHHNFKIPDHFSTKTEEALRTGHITKSVRTEIVQSLSAGIMLFTKQPTPVQYNTVCQKLVDKYSILKDDVTDSKSVFVS